MRILRIHVFALIIGFFTLHSTSAEVPTCSRIDGGRSGYHSLLPPKKFGKNYLIVCGSGDSSNLKKQNDFAVALADSKKSHELFSSDDAFKNYKVTDEKFGVSIDERWSRVGGRGRYFFRTNIRCGEVTCKVELQCLINKTKLRPGKTIGGNPYEMLDLDQRYVESLKLDEGNAENGEELETIESDLKRLRKAGCLPR